MDHSCDFNKLVEILISILQYEVLQISSTHDMGKSEIVVALKYSNKALITNANNVCLIVVRVSLDQFFQYLTVYRFTKIGLSVFSWYFMNNFNLVCCTQPYHLCKRQ